MSGQDESVAYTGVTTESDDMFALEARTAWTSRNLAILPAWGLEDSKAFLVRGDSSTADSSELLCSLDKARNCGEMEAAGLLCGDSSEGRAEFV